MAVFITWLHIMVFYVLPVVFVFVFNAVAVNIARRIFSRRGLAKSLPWVGAKPNGGAFAIMKANWASILNSRELMMEGHVKYTKRGQLYVLPNPLTGPEVVLPVSQMHWLLAQDPSILSQTEVNRRFLEAVYTFLGKYSIFGPDPAEKVWRDLHTVFFPEVIKKHLTKRDNLDAFADDIIDELNACYEEYLGTNTDEWTEVVAYEVALKLITRVVLRVFVGKELCRNEEFIRAASLFNRKVVLSAALLNLIPEFLQPFFAPFITALDTRHYRVITRHIIPLFKRRLTEVLAVRGTLPDGEEAFPNDYIQWAIEIGLEKESAKAVEHEKAAKEGRTMKHEQSELDPQLVAQRLASLLFGAIQSSVITSTHVLFDIAASESAVDPLATMREEILDELQAAKMQRQRDSGSDFGPVWGRALLDNLAHIDSALKESARCNGFVSRGVMKSVQAKGGIKLPDGTHVPYGVKVGVQGYGVHHDEEEYQNADEYDVFRWVAPKLRRDIGDGETISSAASSDGSDYDSDGDASSVASPSDDQTERQAQALQRRQFVQTSPTFLAFSHGKQSCPGRYFAANQLKLMLATFALNYEIEPMPERPANKSFAGSIAPPMTETIRVRRRRDTTV